MYGTITQWAGRMAADVGIISVEALVHLPIFIIRLVSCHRPNLLSTGRYSLFSRETQETSNLDEIKLLTLDHLYFLIYCSCLRRVRERSS